MTRYTVFIGDSYCSSSVQVQPGQHDFQYKSSYPTWCDHICAKTGTDLVLHGYATASWWYSYYQFRQWAKHCNSQWQNTDTVIVCLGDNRRIKTQKLLALDDDSGLKDSILDVIDPLYDYWAYARFVEELIGYSEHRTTVFLPVWYHDTVVLNRVIEQTKGCEQNLVDLCCLQLADARTLSDMTGYELAKGKLYCHFTEENNLHLANSVLTLLDQNSMGWQQLDLTEWNLAGEPPNWTEQRRQVEADCRWFDWVQDYMLG